jgi:O-antigen/teichoic acid export membrane protein
MADDLVRVVGDSARSGSLLAFGMTIATSILVLGSIFTARLLGPELYGQYTLVLVGPQLLFLFTDLGINQGIIKISTNLRCKGENDRACRIVNSGIFLRILTGLIMSLTLYLLAEPFAAVFLNRAELYPFLQMMSIGIFFQALYSTAVSTFVSIDRTEFSAVSSNLEAIVKTSLSILLLLLGFSLFGALVGNLIGYAAAGIIGMILLKIVMPKTSGLNVRVPAKDDMKILLQYGMPIFASFLLTGITPLYQNLILANFTTDVTIGNFKAAFNFATTLTLLSFPITTALLSGFSKLDSAKKENLKVFFKLANKYTSLLVFPIMVIFIVFSGEIIQLVYGQTYQSAPLFLALYCLLYFLVGLGFLNLSSFYNGIGETKMTLKIGVLTFVVVAVLSPFFAQSFGVPGLIAAFLLANTIGTTYGAYVAKKRHNVEFALSAVMRIGLVAFISAVPLFLLRFIGFQTYIMLFLGSLLYLLLYFTLVPFMGIVTESELESADSIVRRLGPLRFIAVKVLRLERALLRQSLSFKQRNESSK